MVEDPIRIRIYGGEGWIPGTYTVAPSGWSGQIGYPYDPVGTYGFAFLEGAFLESPPTPGGTPAVGGIGRPEPKFQTLFEGDSNTVGSETSDPGATTSYPYLVNAAQAAQFAATRLYTPMQMGVTNVAGSGRTLVQMVDQGEERCDNKLDVHLYRGSTLFIMGGTNDLFLGATAAATYAKLLEWLGDRRAAGHQKIAVATIPPCTHAGRAGTWDTEWPLFNALIKAGVDLWDGIVLTDEDPRLANPDDTDKYADKLHWTDLGNEIMAELVEPVQEGLLAEAAPVNTLQAEIGIEGGGDPVVGATAMVVTPAEWTGGVCKLTYQWYLNSEIWEGQTGRTVLMPDMEDAVVGLILTAHNEAGSTIAGSANTLTVVFP